MSGRVVTLCHHIVCDPTRKVTFDNYVCVFVPEVCASLCMCICLFVYFSCVFPYELYNSMLTFCPSSLNLVTVVGRDLFSSTVWFCQTISHGKHIAVVSYVSIMKD